MSDRTTKVWFCEPIATIRAFSDPGGDALTITEAKALRAELDTAIQKAQEADR